MQHQPCEIEQVERTAMEMVVTAIQEYLPEAVRIWRHERDEAKDIAEDIRERRWTRWGSLEPVGGCTGRWTSRSPPGSSAHRQRDARCSSTPRQRKQPGE